MTNSVKTTQQLQALIAKTVQYNGCIVTHDKKRGFYIKCGNETKAALGRSGAKAMAWLEDCILQGKPNHAQLRVMCQGGAKPAPNASPRRAFMDDMPQWMSDALGGAL